MNLTSQAIESVNEGTPCVGDAKSAVGDDTATLSIIETRELTQELGQHLFTQNESQLREHSEAIAKHLALREVYVSIVLDSRIKHKDPVHDRRITIAASNAISILNYGSCRGIFPFRFIDVRDWSGIRVPGANLDYGVMVNCNLNDADLSRSSMSKITLCYSQLRRANLSDVKSEIQAMIRPPRHLYVVGITPQRHLLVPLRPSRSIVELWNLEGTQCLGETRCTSGEYVCVGACSRDGRYLVLSSSTESTLHVWDTLAFTRKTTLQLEESVRRGPRPAAAFSPDNRNLVTVWRDDTIRIWDLETSQVVNTFEHPGVACVDWSPKGDKIVSGAETGDLMIWDLATPMQPIIAKAGSQGGWHSLLRFSGDGRYVLSCLRNDIHVWNATTGAKKVILTGHKGEVRCLVADPDGQHVYFAADNIRCWNLETEQCVSVLDHNPVLLVLTTDGRTLISREHAGTTMLWDVEALKRYKHSLPNLEGDYAIVSADNRHVVVVRDQERMVSICDTASGVGGTTISQRVLDLPSGVSLDAARPKHHSPNGKLLACVGDKTIYVWDLERPEYFAELKSDDLLDNDSLEFSPNTNLVAITTRMPDRKVQLWDVMTQECTILCKTNGNTMAGLCFSPDGRMLGVAMTFGNRFRTIQIWNIAMQEVVSVISDPGLPFINYSSCGRFIVTMGRNMEIQIYSAMTGTCLRTIEVECFGRPSFHPSGQFIVVREFGESIKMYSIAPPQPYSCTFRIRPWPFSQLPHMSLGGTVMASMCGKTAVDLWYLPELPWKSEVIRRGDASLLPLMIVPTLQAHQDVSRDATNRFSIVATSCEDGSLSMQHGSSTALTTLQGHSELVACMQLSPDNAYLATGSYDNTVRIWNLARQECVQILEGHTNAVTCVGFSSDARLVASGSYDTTIRVWNIKEATCVAHFEGHVSAIKQVRFSPDGHQLASTGSVDHVIRIWDITTGECSRILDGQHTDEVFDIQYPSPAQGTYLISGSLDAGVCVWETKTGECMRILKGHNDSLTCFVVTSDGQTVVTGSDDATICVWDWVTGECTAILKGHTESVRSLALTPDDRCLISASYDQVIHVWHVPTGELLHQLYGHTKPVTSVKLVHYDAQGESILVSTSSDRAVRAWRIHAMPSRMEGYLELRDVVGIPMSMNFRGADFSGAKMHSNFMDLVEEYDGTVSR